MSCVVMLGFAEMVDKVVYMASVVRKREVLGADPFEAFKRKDA